MHVHYARLSWLLPLLLNIKFRWLLPLTSILLCAQILLCHLTTLSVWNPALLVLSMVTEYSGSIALMQCGLTILACIGSTN
jgi:hypothetical protein